MGLEHARLIGATDASGDLTLISEKSIYGLLWEIEWIDDDLADGVDAVLSAINTPSGVDRTLLTLTNANDDAWYRPRELEQDNTGSDGSNRVPMTVAGTLQLVISSGGDTKTGGAIVHYLD